jgi:hypothetical protein
MYCRGSVGRPFAANVCQRDIPPYDLVDIEEYCLLGCDTRESGVRFGGKHCLQLPGQNVGQVTKKANSKEQIRIITFLC